MITFWIAAALLSALVALPVLAGAARGARAEATPEDPTLALHRRQLAEIDELAARGLLSEDDSRIARAEAGRRLLASADAAQPVVAGDKVRKFAVAAAVAAPILGVGLYLVVGSPRFPDQPFAARVAAWGQADPRTLQPSQLAVLLEGREPEFRNDPRFYATLATVKARANDLNGATIALRRAIAIGPPTGDLWAQLGELLVAGANDVVTDEARAAFSEALRLQPEQPIANYFLGRRLIEEGRTAEGVAAWRVAQAQLPEAARPSLQREIDIVQATGRLPSAGGGSQPEVGPEQIAAMVEGLAARLKTSPDDPEGWVRLVRAYTVLNQTAKRDAALAEARARYKDNAEVLRSLDSAVQVGQ